jgi:hypothetical protein
VVEESTTRLIQICASQNDLFGLDDDGRVYQYNFNTNTWMRLGRGRSGEAEAPSASLSSVARLREQAPESTLS